LLYTVKEKGKGGNPVRKPYPFTYGLRNPYKNLKPENYQDYAQKHQRNSTFMHSASVHGQRKHQLLSFGTPGRFF
jgi:hypothetical protein